MPRLSLWRENKASDYKFIDRRISEMFTIGGTGIILHKYLGTQTANGAVAGTGVTAIQDLLWLENRDRKYDTSVYTLRGIYQKQDQDFDLSQFGIFLAAGTQFMTFHLNDIVETVGRKIIAGDVLELMHLKDYHALDDTIPFAIKRYYVVSDASWAAEGFSPTWYPHLWRVKLQPLVDSQEYKDILNKISADSDPFTANANVSPLSDIVSTYNKYRDVNQSIIAEAEVNLPRSGYNTANLYVVDRNAIGQISDPNPKPINAGNINVSGGNSVTYTVTSTKIKTDRILIANAFAVTVGSVFTNSNIIAANNVTVTGLVGKNGIILSEKITVASGETITLTFDSNTTTDASVYPPKDKVHGYLSGDGTAPNGLEVNMGVAFPNHAKSGDYFLRLDFVPNRLFRFDGKRWVKIEDSVRTNLTPGAVDNQTLRNSFFNDSNTFTDSKGNEHNERQSLSKILTPKADN